MSNGLVGVVAASGLLVALAVGGYVLAQSPAPEATSPADDGWRTTQEEAVRAVTDRVKALERQVRRRDQELEALRTRIDGMKPARADGPSDPPLPDTAVAQDTVDPETAKRELAALREKVWAGEASREEEARFWELARTTGVLNEIMKDLEGDVNERPADVAARMKLAGAYVAKLLTVPDGPERGLWAMKAENQWQKILAQDETHWEARFSVAFTWSRYPDFLNKTPDAIKEFEKLQEIQERAAPQEQHAQTYVQLFTLYRKQGNSPKARTALEQGLERHPGHEGMTKALDSMGD